MVAASLLTPMAPPLRQVPREAGSLLAVMCSRPRGSQRGFNNSQKHPQQMTQRWGRGEEQDKKKPRGKFVKWPQEFELYSRVMGSSPRARRSGSVEEDCNFPAKIKSRSLEFTRGVTR